MGLPASAKPRNSVITLSWTAPGDDGERGEATRYDVRYSLEPITLANFTDATPVHDVPHPANAGTRQRLRVRGLEAGKNYYFALRSVDEMGNWSGISNVVAKAAPDPVSDPGKFEVALSAPMPNPMTTRTVFELTLPEPTDVRIVVIDLAGRQVKTLAEGEYPAGITSLYWDVRDHFGFRLFPGSYWVRARLGSEVASQRFTVLP